MFEIFEKEIINPDLIRSNMFSVSMGCGPGSKLISTFDNLVSPLFDDTWVEQGLNNLGIGTNIVATALDEIASQQMTKWLNKSGGRRILAAMNSRVVESFLGQFYTGTAAMDYFSEVQMIDTSVMAVRVPEQSIGHGYTTNDTGGRTHKFNVLNPGYLSITFRQTPNRNMYQVFKDYIDAVVNPENNLRHFVDDISCAISVNQHTRDGLPFMMHQFDGCVPIRLGELNFSYENNNEILTFEVEFAHTSHWSGPTGRELAKSWAETFTSIAAAKLGDRYGAKIDSMIGNIGTGIANGIGGIGGIGGKINTFSDKFGGILN